MKIKITSLMAASFLVAASASAAAVESTGPRVPRDFFNDGTQQLGTNKLREAEAALQTAVASNNEKVQPAALYNLGFVRFRQGVEALKEASDPRAAKARGDAAADLAGKAIKDADAALAANELDAIVRAYQQGRGTRKELKAALAAVKKALEEHGAVLRRWQRASGDFKSAHELRPAFADAQHNGDVVDRHIARLVDKQEMMMQCMQCMDGKKGDLQQRMLALKKKLPDGSQPKDQGEEDEDEDDPKEPPKEPKAGHQEKENKEGHRMELTWEEAMRLLDSLKLDANRKLSMGDQETANPKERKGKDW